MYKVCDSLGQSIQSGLSYQAAVQFKAMNNRPDWTIEKENPKSGWCLSQWVLRH
jgi:hypothetical protein